MDAQVLFILVLIVFSILDGLARKAKKQRQMELPGPDEPGREGWPTSDRLPEATTDSRGAGPAETRGAPGPPRRTAEDMVPRDVWEEIAALARGELPRSPPEQPRTSEGKATETLPVPAPPATLEPSRQEAALEERPRRDVAVPAGVDSRVSRRPEVRSRVARPRTFDRAATERPVLDGPAVVMKRRKHVGRGLGTREGLRRAVVATEILGRPLALREDGED